MEGEEKIRVKREDNELKPEDLYTALDDFSEIDPSLWLAQEVGNRVAYSQFRHPAKSFYIYLPR